MTTIAIQDAQIGLPEIIHQLCPGEEVLITENGKPVARIIGATQPHLERTLGSMRGTVLHMSEDFDAPLDDFREHIQ